MSGCHCAIITISDTRTPDTDESGRCIREMLEHSGQKVVLYCLLPDEPALVRAQLEVWSAEAALDSIVLNGGTGIAPRDTTYDVLRTMLEKELPGFGEIFRALSWEQVGSRAIASRATAGIYRGKVVFSLPGSTKAVRLAMEKLILPELEHLVRQVRGEGH